MNKIWTSFTVMAVATAVHSPSMSAATVAVPSVSSIPVVSELSVTELPTQEALPQLPETQKSSSQPVAPANVYAFVSEPEQQLSITANTVGSVFKQFQEQLSELPRPSEILADSLTAQSSTLDLEEPKADQPNAETTDNLDVPEVAPLPKTQVLATQVGGASWYGFEGGTVTATGERYNPQGLSAAHRSLPFGSEVMVTNLRNNKSVIVRINDRGPFVPGRIIDLSEAAAEMVGIKSSGVGNVRVDVLSYGYNRGKSRR